MRGSRVKQEQWIEMNRVERKAFLRLLLLWGVYKASGESTKELWSADGRKDFLSTMSFNRFVQYSFIIYLLNIVLLFTFFCDSAKIISYTNTI